MKAMCGGPAAGAGLAVERSLGRSGLAILTLIAVLAIAAPAAGDDFTWVGWGGLEGSDPSWGCAGLEHPGNDLVVRPLATANGVVYETSFDALALGITQPAPGDPGQDGWYAGLADGDAYGEIQDAVAKVGRALHEHGPATNACGAQTIDRRDLAPLNLGGTQVITLEADVLCRTSNLDAINPYTASLEVWGGPHPGYQAIGFGISSGNGIQRGLAGVSVSLGCFNGVDNNEPIPLTVGQGLAWDQWHHVEVAIDQAADSYRYIEVDGVRQSLTAWRPPRSFWDGEWRRGQLVDGILAQVIPCPWEPTDVTDDDVFWDNISLTVGPRLRSEVVRTGPEEFSKTGPAGDLSAPRAVLLSVAPNPTVGETRVRFAVPEGMEARLEIFDATGRRVRTLLDGRATSGAHERPWDGRDDHGRLVPAGTYFARLEAGGFARHEKVVLLR